MPGAGERAAEEGEGRVPGAGERAAEEGEGRVPGAGERAAEEGEDSYGSLRPTSLKMAWPAKCWRYWARASSMASSLSMSRRHEMPWPHGPGQVR